MVIIEDVGERRREREVQLAFLIWVTWLLMGGSAVYQIFLLFFKYLFELCVENWQRLRKEFLFSNFSRETERSTEHVCRARAPVLQFLPHPQGGFPTRDFSLLGRMSRAFFFPRSLIRSPRVWRARRARLCCFGSRFEIWCPGAECGSDVGRHTRVGSIFNSS